MTATSCPECGGATLSGHCPARHNPVPSNFSVWEEFAASLDADNRRAALEILVGDTIDIVPSERFAESMQRLRAWAHREHSRKVSGSPYQE